MAALQEVSENWDDDFEFQVEKRKMSTLTTATENWDDDFEDSRQSPKKIVQRHSWDDDEEDDENGLFAEEDRTVTAKSRRAALARLSTPLPPLIPGHHYPHPRSPTSSVFSVPTTIHTYSSTAHLRPTSAFALLPPSPPIHKERERRRLRKKSRPKPQGVFELTDMPSALTQERPSFSDAEVDLPRPVSELGIRRTEASSRSDLSSVDERPAPDVSAVVDTSIRSSNGPLSIPPTPTKGAALLSRIGSVKKWGVRRKRGESTDATAMSNDRRNEVDPQLTPRASSSLSSYQQKQQQHHSPPPLPPVLPSSHGESSHSTTQPQPQQQRATPSNWFFRSASKSSNNTNTGSTSSSPSAGVVRSRKSRSRSRVRNGQEEGGIANNSPGNSNTTRNGNANANPHHTPNFYSTRTPNESRTDLSDRDNAMSSRKMSGNAGKRRKDVGVDSFGSGPDGDGSSGRGAGNAEPPTLTATTTPTKLMKRKSFGFVHLGRGFGGHGGGENEVLSRSKYTSGDVVGIVVDDEGEGEDGDGQDRMYAGLGLGRSSAGVDRGGDGGDECEKSERSRRRSLSRFLLHRDKEKGKDGIREKENEDRPKEKEGTRSFMGSVRRISLVPVVGRHKRTKSGGVSPARIPPVPPVLTSASQVSLRISSMTTTTNAGSSQRYPSSILDLRRAASLSSPTTSGNTTFSSSATPRSHSSSNSRPPSISSSSSTKKRRLRTLSKTKPKPSKSEGESSQEFIRDRVLKSSLEERGDRDPEGDMILKTPTRSTSSAPAVSSQPSPAAAIPLLPPIELQPPSPPRTTPNRHIQRRSRAYTTSESTEGLDLETLDVTPSASGSSVFFTPASSVSRNVGGAGVGGILPLPSLSPNKLSPGKSPSHSQQSVSLGRSTAVNVAGGDENGGLLSASGSGGSGGGGGLLRRNSLGDLKIPARISQAQVGLRRDLGLVREFASNVEQLKELQNTYNTLIVEVQALLDTHMQRVQPPQPVERSPLPAVAPHTTNFFAQLKIRPKTRARSNTNPTTGSPTHAPDVVDSSSLDVMVTSSQVAFKSLVEAFWGINSKYKTSWECAELLIELGSGSGGNDGGGGAMSAPASAVTTTSVSAPVIQQNLTGTGGDGNISSLKGRERALTLACDEPKPTTPPPQPTHNEAQTQVQSQPSSTIVPITGSSSMPGGMPLASATGSGGPPLASPPSMSWRASTGRHDLSQRQLVLLRGMLNNNNGASTVTASGDDEGDLRSTPPHLSISVGDDPELRPSVLSPYYPSSHSQFVNRDWRWGDAMNSTITLLEEQVGGLGVGLDEGGRSDQKMEEKKRKRGRLGMSGIRDMLRLLKKNHMEEPQIGNSNLSRVQSGQQYHHHHRHGHLPTVLAHPLIHSTTSLSTESSIGSKNIRHQAQAPQENRLPIPRIPSQIRRRGRASTGPESMGSNKAPSPTPFNTASFTTPKPSSRHPSLASIFRIGSSNNNKMKSVSSIVHTGAGVGVENPAALSCASERDLSTAQSSGATTGTGGEESNSMGEEEEEDWDRMDSTSDLDATAVVTAKALGAVDGAYDGSATVRGRTKFKTKADEKKVGVSPYLQHKSSYESDHHHSPPPLPASSSTGLGGFLARHSIIPKRSFSASQSSIWGSGGVDGQQHHHRNVPSRLSRHSNFEQQQSTNTGNAEPASLPISSSKLALTTTTPAAQSKPPNKTNVDFTASNIPGVSSRPSSLSPKFPNAKTASVRSMPPHLVTSSLLPNGFQGQPSALSSLPDPKLAMIMTPENIKPLLENAKEVHVKLHECIVEIQALIEDGAAAIGHTGVKTQGAPTC